MGSQPSMFLCVPGWAAEGLDPAPRAGAETLIRRLYLDLIGLPPTPVEFKRYLSLAQNGADSRAAYSQTVDELLARPGFGGEVGSTLARLGSLRRLQRFRKGRPARDVALAGLGDRGLSTRTCRLTGSRRCNWQEICCQGRALSRSWRRASCGNSMANEEGGIDPEEYHVEAVADRVETVGTVFLATTFGCARCHDHKFDPISPARVQPAVCRLQQSRARPEAGQQLHQRSGRPQGVLSRRRGGGTPGVRQGGLAPGAEHVGGRSRGTSRGALRSVRSHAAIAEKARFHAGDA